MEREQRESMQNSWVPEFTGTAISRVNGGVEVANSKNLLLLWIMNIQTLCGPHLLQDIKSTSNEL